MNKFKIGDRVRVYDSNHEYAAEHIEGNVIIVHGDFLYIVNGNSGGIRYHYKQCRKLKKKEPKYLFINEYSWGYGKAWETARRAFDEFKAVGRDEFKRQLKLRVVKSGKAE